MPEKSKWKELVLELDRLREEKKESNKNFNEAIENINKSLIALALQDDNQTDLKFESTDKKEI